MTPPTPEIDPDLNSKVLFGYFSKISSFFFQYFKLIMRIRGVYTLAVEQGWARPDLDHRDRDRDWKCLSLNNETETETEKVWVSMTRPRPRLKMLSLNNETETETGKIWVSKTRLGKKCRYRDSIETHADLWYDTGLLVGWSRFFLPYRAYSAIKSQNLML